MRALEEVSSKAYPGLDRSPKENWVDKAGGLPSYIERVAKHLHYEKSKPIGTAIATAVNWVKKGCATGTTFGGKVKVSAATKAKMCKAVAEWEAKKAKSKASSLKEAEELLEAGGPEIELTEEDAASILEVVEARLGRVEVVRASLAPPGARTGGVQAAKALMEADWAEPVALRMGGPFADRAEATALRRELSFERADLRGLIEALGGSPPADKKDADEEATARVRKAADRGPRDRPTEPHSGSEPLAKGSAGELVGHAQTRLRELGYDVQVDGDYGEETDGAVRSFQDDHKLKVDGVLGRETKMAMRGTTPVDVTARRTEKASAPVSPSGDSDQAATDGEAPANDSEPTAKGDQGAAKGSEPTAKGAAPRERSVADLSSHEWLMKGRGVGAEPDTEVQRRQEQLLAMGTFIGDPGADGRFGPETEKGVKRIQRRYGLKPTGVVDPETGALLDRNGTRAPGSKDVEEAGKRYAVHDAPQVARARRATAAPAGRDGQPVNSDFEKKHKRVGKGRTGGGQFAKESESEKSSSSPQTGKDGQAQTFASGAQGGQISRLQDLLGIKQTGNFDKNTVRRVREYQKNNDLLVDGIVGSQTLSSLLGQEPTDPGVLTPDLLKELRGGDTKPVKPAAAKPAAKPAPAPAPAPAQATGGSAAVAAPAPAPKVASKQKAPSTPAPIASPSEDSLPEAKAKKLASEGWDYHDGYWFPPGHPKNKRSGKVGEKRKIAEALDAPASDARLLVEAAYVLNPREDGETDAAYRDRLLAEAGLLGRLGSAIRSGGEFLDRSGTAVRRLPGGKWQQRDRNGKWIDMPGVPDLRGITPSSEVQRLDRALGNLHAERGMASPGTPREKRLYGPIATADLRQMIKTTPKGEQRDAMERELEQPDRKPGMASPGTGRDREQDIYDEAHDLYDGGAEVDDPRLKKLDQRVAELNGTTVEALRKEHPEILPSTDEAVQRWHDENDRPRGMYSPGTGPSKKEWQSVGFTPNPLLPENYREMSDADLSSKVLEPIKGDKSPAAQSARVAVRQLLSERFNAPKPEPSAAEKRSQAAAEMADLEMEDGPERGRSNLERLQGLKADGDAESIGNAGYRDAQHLDETIKLVKERLSEDPWWGQGMASPAARVQRQAFLQRDLEGSGALDLPGGTAIRQGSNGWAVEHGGRTATLALKPGEALAVGLRLDNPISNREAGPAWKTFTSSKAKPKKRRAAAETLAGLAGIRATALERSLGMASPGLVPTGFTSNDKAVDMGTMPVGQTLALKSGATYVKHKQNGNVVIVKPVDADGKVLATDPETGKSVRTLNVLHAPYSVGPVSPDYGDGAPADTKADAKAVKDAGAATQADDALFDALQASVTAAQKGELPVQKKKAAAAAKPKKGPMPTVAEKDLADKGHTPGTLPAGYIEGEAGDAKLGDVPEGMKVAVFADPEKGWEERTVGPDTEGLNPDTYVKPLGGPQKAPAADTGPKTVEHPVEATLDPAGILPQAQALQPGDTYDLPGGRKIVRTKDSFILNNPDGDLTLHPSAEDAATAAAALYGTAPDPTTATAASLLGDDWSADDVDGALGQLEGQGITLDPKAESPETLAAVIKAAGIEPEKAPSAATSAPEAPSARETPPEPDTGPELGAVAAKGNVIQLPGGGVKVGNREYHELSWTNDAIMTAADVGSLDGKSVVVTGKIDGETRKTITAKLEAAGATVLSGVEKDPDYLIVGQKAGSKLKKAREQDIPIIPDAELKALVEALLDEGELEEAEVHALLTGEATALDVTLLDQTDE